MNYRTQQLTNGLCKQLLSDKKNLTGIQIGNFFGDSTLSFINTNAFDKLYCIDPYIPNFDPDDQSTGNLVVQAEKVFENRFKNDKRVIKIKKKSVEAVDLFQDESIDFIYIDGCHRYENVKQDLNNYYPKIKKGGMICGHDYDLSNSIYHIRGVKLAINEFFKKNPLKVFLDMSWLYYKDI